MQFKNIILSQKLVNTAFLSRKFINTAYLSRKFINTRLSIDFKDLLDPSIAPQIVPPCFSPGPFVTFQDFGVNPKRILVTPCTAHSTGTRCAGGAHTPRNILPETFLSLLSSSASQLTSFSAHHLILVIEYIYSLNTILLLKNST